jgi:hypothetical protein
LSSSRARTELEPAGATAAATTHAEATHAEAAGAEDARHRRVATAVAADDRAVPPVASIVPPRRSRRRASLWVPLAIAAAAALVVGLVGRRTIEAWLSPAPTPTPEPVPTASPATAPDRVATWLREEAFVACAERAVDDCAHKLDEA